jgi:hypothetical protein
MQALLLSVQALHVVPAVFWAGTTFALARSGGAGAERLVGPQVGAMGVTILAGAGLWALTHRGAFGSTERLLAVGIACALLAGAIQVVRALPAARKLRAAGEADAQPLRRRIAAAEGVAMLLLIVTVVCMTASRYV